MSKGARIAEKIINLGINKAKKHTNPFGQPLATVDFGSEFDSTRSYVIVELANNQGPQSVKGRIVSLVVEGKPLHSATGEVIPEEIVSKVYKEFSDKEDDELEKFING